MIIVWNNNGDLQHLLVLGLAPWIGVKLRPLRALAGLEATEGQPKQASIDHTLDPFTSGYPDDSFSQYLR